MRAVWADDGAAFKKCSCRWKKLSARCESLESFVRPPRLSYDRTCGLRCEIAAQGRDVMSLHESHLYVR
jgi:hypothetical protein